MPTDKITEAFVLGESYGLHENGIQREYATRVGEMIACAIESPKKSGQGFIEGETGTGKTMGYLIPILLQIAESGQRAIISTYTLSLQKQLMSPGGDMERAIAVVEQMTGKRLTAARRIGRRNFVDCARVQMLYSKKLVSDTSDIDSPEWDDLLEWCKITRTGELQEFLDGEDESALPVGLTPEDICVTRHSDDISLEHYQAHAQAALAADVVVTNHAMLVRSAMHGIRLLHDPKGGREIDVLLVDEVDRIVSVAEDATSDLLSISETERLAELWGESCEDESGEHLLAAIKDLRELMTELYPQYTQKGNEGILMWSEMGHAARNNVTTLMVALAEAAAPVLDAVSGHSDDASLEGMLEPHLRLCIALMKDMTSDGGNGSLLALRWSPHRMYPSIRKFRLHPLRVLAGMWKVFKNGAKSEDENQGELPLEGGIGIEIDDAALRRRAKAVILTSATISAPRRDGLPDFGEMKVDMGVYDKENPCADLHAGFSPKRFGSADFVFPSPDAPQPFLPNKEDFAEPMGEIEEESVGREINPEWVKYAANMVKAAREDRPGRILVLANSYRSTALLSDAIRELGISVIEKARHVRMEECLSRVSGKPDAVFVSPSAWEGMDLQSRGVKNAWAHVVMSQLPYGAADGAREKAIRRDLVARGKSDEQAKRMGFIRVLKSALRKARQGFGRGIRSPEDHMTFWVADPRFPTPISFMRDTSGMIPSRTVKAKEDFMFIIPKRFRSGMVNRVEHESRMFLTSGRLVLAAEVRKAA